MDEARNKPTFVRWLNLDDGKILKYANNDYIKGGDDEKQVEEKLLKRIIQVTNQNKKKTTHLVAMLCGKRVTVRVYVGGNMEGAEQRKHISRDEAWPIVGNHRTFMEWEQLVDGATIKYGSRTFTKGRLGQEEMLMGLIVRTHELNAKRSQKGIGVLAAAATEEGGKRGPRRRVEALSEALSPAVVVVKGQKIGKSGNNNDDKYSD